MGALLQTFLTCCTFENLSGNTFATEPTIAKSLIRRTTELSAAKLLHENSSRATVAFLLDDFQPLDAPPDVVRVVLKPCPRIFDAEVGRTHEALLVAAQLRMHLARMEVQGCRALVGWSTPPLDCAAAVSFKNTEHAFTCFIHCPSMALFDLVSVKLWSIAVRTKHVAWRAVAAFRPSCSERLRT
ncbi:hypothetical protein JG687_00017957 [Phytophthora cactorum]|uniref:Uncharacterized protein n=1 Tax=Phytophthora cactorum TaxID=29920 RepID=A0A8T1TMY3_9STRA|nr:hypothetical protein JG687_00017957 [Phytophthora cactorum]